LSSTHCGLRAQGISLATVRDAVRNSNQDIGGRTVELSEFEYVVRGRGYIKSQADIEDIMLKTDHGAPLFLKDVARVEIGPMSGAASPSSTVRARLRAASHCSASAPMRST
jgi:Cu/Ag efflux pump CusA